MIEIENLEKTYGDGTVVTSVLKNVTFRVEAGELVALMGASGTGKSTLLNILGGLDKPTRGRYRLAGTDVLGLNDDALSRLRNRRIGFVFQQFHLLARALITDPAIVLADEPTGNLDRKSGLEILAIFQRLHRDGRTLLIVTHDIAIAEHADRILVMRDGQVTEDRIVPHPRNAADELEELGRTAAEQSSAAAPNLSPA